MKFYNKTYVFFSIILMLFMGSSYCAAHKDGTLKKQQNDFVTLLAELRALPEISDCRIPEYPKAKKFTANMILETSDAFVLKMKQRLDTAEWVEGGTQQHFFVRKLIVPEDSVIEFRGDLHGDVHSLIRWIDSLRAQGWFEEENPFKLKQNSIKKHRYLAFLGDYTDRGHYGAEVMYIILQLFLHNPDNILIVRGNHEDYRIISENGFVQELKTKLLLDDVDIQRIAAVYACMPVALFLGCKNKSGGIDFIQCCHGGMEPRYDSRTLLHDADNKRWDVYEWLHKGKLEHGDGVICRRDGQYEREHCLCQRYTMHANGFQWNDFDFFNAYPFRTITRNNRGSYDFYQDYTTYLLKSATSENSKNRVLAVFRAHQHKHETIPHILQYGNGIYQHWHALDAGEIRPGFDWVMQWSGKQGEPVGVGMYSVWTFNVAPRTGFFNAEWYWQNSGNTKDLYKKFDYDTVARLGLKPGFKNWTLHPRKIPAL